MQMRHYDYRKYAQNVLIGATAVVFAGGRLMPSHNQTGPVLRAATAMVTGRPAATSFGDVVGTAAVVSAETNAALASLSGAVGPLSHPQALEDAFKSYFGYKSAHPADIKKPYLYFVDYGLPSTQPRGYVFNMDSLRVEEGPFTVAHGRGSSTSRYGVPTRFSNASGAQTTSLGLYVTKALYAFHGKTGGRSYSSVGLKLDGVSKGYNDQAMARGVVAHGAPYVTPTKAGRSEGCPAMEPSRAKELLPKLADGAMVFLFAPDSKWMAGDEWLAGTATGSEAGA
jgi:hypothetical protein